MEEIKKVIDRLKKAAELCMSTGDDIACLECEYQAHCTSGKNTDILRVVEWAEKKLKSTVIIEKDEAVKHQSVGGIKGERDEALMNLYKHYNRLTALDEIGYAESEMMRDMIDDIAKLEHERNMEASNEIAKMAIEKLEKLAAPIPEIRMSGIPKEVRAALDKYEKKEGAENDD